jgi:hypothetical protein
MIDRSRWHPCTSLWRELPGRRFERTAVTLTDPVFVEKYGPRFYSLRLDFSCQAGRTNDTCSNRPPRWQVPYNYFDLVNLCHS